MAELEEEEVLEAIEQAENAVEGAEKLEEDPDEENWNVRYPHATGHFEGKCSQCYEWGTRRRSARTQEGRVQASTHGAGLHDVCARHSTTQLEQVVLDMRYEYPLAQGLLAQGAPEETWTRTGSQINQDQKKEYKQEPRRRGRGQ